MPFEEKKYSNIQKGQKAKSRGLDYNVILFTYFVTSSV